MLDVAWMKMLAAKSCVNCFRTETTQNDVKEKTTTLRLNIDYIYDLKFALFRSL